MLRELLPQAPSSISAIRPIRAPTCPTSGGLEGYDGVVITGSALHVYERGPHIDPQIELAKAVLDARTPLFGSCWGLQVITVAAGGSVRRNPKGREIGFGRRIRLTASGRGHPMYAGKDEVFDAVTVHLDEVETRRARHAGAGAAISSRPCRSAEIRVNGCTRLGHAISSRIFARRHRGDLPPLRQALVDDGSSTDETNLHAYAEELDMINVDPTDKWLAWRLRARLRRARQEDPDERSPNWIHHQVLPTRETARAGSNDWIFADRHVVITGGTGALGTAVVGALLDAGAHCHVPYIRERRSRAFSARAE